MPRDPDVHRPEDYRMPGLLGMTIEIDRGRKPERLDGHPATIAAFRKALAVSP